MLFIRCALRCWMVPRTKTRGLRDSPGFGSRGERGPKAQEKVILPTWFGKVWKAGAVDGSFPCFTWSLVVWLVVSCKTFCLQPLPWKNHPRYTWPHNFWERFKSPGRNRTQRTQWSFVPLPRRSMFPMKPVKEFG